MFVVKRDGRKESAQFDKLTRRMARLCVGLDGQFVDAAVVSKKVADGAFDGMTTQQVDELAAETAAYMATTHPDFAILAARVAVSSLHKATLGVFSDTIEALHGYVHPKTGQSAPLVSDEVVAAVRQHRDRLNAAVDYQRDLNYNFFGFRTLQRSYLLKLHGAICERPQDMLMRVSLGIHPRDVDRAIETYDLMSNGWFTHASPTLFNAGTPNQQMSSCFLLCMVEDSIEGIYETLKRCAMISKSAGGIGLSVHNIRATGSYIRGTNGSSNGIVPMLRVFSDTARYVDQGGGKRKGAFAVFLEPWHADVLDFLDLRKNHGKEEMRARDLFYALWINDLFMRRVEANQDWTLFCPNEAPGLADAWGNEFEDLYTKYEAEGLGRRKIKAQQLWFAILESQIETGTPYMLYKDACNRKSNHQHLGTIKSSNLCTEVMQFTSPDEVAVCNLASIALPRFVKDGAFDHQRLREVVHVVTRNLDAVIDRNHYPIPQARDSNLRHRPLGLGVQGLADVFLELGLPFASPEAAALNRQIFETIYFAALEQSCALAELHGPHESYPGSPVSNGLLQMDLWEQEAVDKGVAPHDAKVPLSAHHDWDGLRARIAKHGVRNSLLVAPMPTASTSQLLGNNECFEPYTSNVYTRRVLSGEFAMVNRHLVRDLIRLGLWCPELKDKLIADNGSVQNIAGIPDRLKEVYRTVWEIKQRALIDMAADRGAFIDQSQSLSLFVSSPNFAKLSSMHFHAWKKGLKTGMYYLRTQAACDAIKFTVPAGLSDRVAAPACPWRPAREEGEDECHSCSA